MDTFDKKYLEFINDKVAKMPFYEDVIQPKVARMSLNMQELRVQAAEELGKIYCDEFDANEKRLSKEEQIRIYFDRIWAFNRLKNYLDENGSEDQKFQFEASLIGAKMRLKLIQRKFQGETCNYWNVRSVHRYCIDVESEIYLRYYEYILDCTTYEIDHLHFEYVDQDYFLDEELQGGEVDIDYFYVDNDDKIRFNEKILSELYDIELVDSSHTETLTLSVLTNSWSEGESIDDFQRFKNSFSRYTSKKRLNLIW